MKMNRGRAILTEGLTRVAAPANEAHIPAYLILLLAICAVVLLARAAIDWLCAAWQEQIDDERREERLRPWRRK